jgi:hypothetical protein
MNSTAFSLLANSSSELDGSEEMELTIGSLGLIIGPSGSSRLSDSTKPDPLANKPKTEETLESSEGSSSEVNSPVSLEKAPIAEGDKLRENFDSEERVYQTHSNAKDFVEFLHECWKIFAWCPPDMPGVPRELVEHALNIDPKAKPV